MIIIPSERTASEEQDGGRGHGRGTPQLRRAGEPVVRRGLALPPSLPSAPAHGFGWQTIFSAHCGGYLGRRLGKPVI
jgi:hypothetical protein